MRQCAVYQYADLKDHTETWVIIQPDIVAFDFFCSQEFCGPSRKAHGYVRAHEAWMDAAVKDWKRYIAYLRHRLRAIVRAQRAILELLLLTNPKQDEKACFSRLDSQCNDDFIVQFADRQQIQGLRQHLLRARIALQSTIDTFHTLEEHFTEVGTAVCKRGTIDPLIQKLRGRRRTLQYYLRAVVNLLDYAAYTEQLVSTLKPISLNVCDGNFF